MSNTTNAMGSFYDEKRASSDLRKYRDKGPIPSTQALIEALKAEGIEGMTLLDIGGGIGAIQHELLDAGVTRVTVSTPPLLSSTRHARRARAAATKGGSPTCTVTSLIWPTRSPLPTS